MIRLALALAALLFPLLTGAAADDPKQPAAPDLTAHKACAERLEAAIRENDKETFDELFDSDALVARILKDLPAPPDFRTKFRAMGKGFGGQFLTELSKKSSGVGCGVKLLRVRVVDGEPRALFRNVSEGGLNYLDFVLSKPEKGKPVRVVDAYVAVSGEYLSRIMGPVLSKAIAAYDKAGNLADLNAATDRMQAIARFASLVRAGKSKEALTAYEKLPAEYKKEKVVMLMHVLVTAARMEEDPAAYEQSIDAFIKAFPTDPAVELVSLDGFLLKKKYAEFQKAVDRLDKAVGGDPYLHVLRGNGLQIEGKSAEAKKAIGRAIAGEPDLVAAYIALADVALAQKDYKELARLLTTLETKFALDFSGVATVDEYAGFRKSPEYKDWWEKRKKK